jgi:TonB family protein
MHRRAKNESLSQRLWSRATLCIILAFSGLQLLSLAQQQSPSESQVKAAYLLNFARLAEWPPAALPDGPSPFDICIGASNESFLQVVKSVIAGKMIGTHPVTVRPANSEDDLNSCQIIFFRASGKKHTEAAFENLPRTGVLLVGEDESFLRQGGMINLVRDHGSIRFDVNPDAMDRSEIHFSSKILAMAKASYGAASATATPSNSSSDGTRRLERSPAPQYPELAEHLKLSGTAQVEVIVKPDGSVREVRVLGGHPLLADALATAVKQWKYQPSLKETTEIVKFSFVPH